jgi:Restriction endonuclease
MNEDRSILYQQAREELLRRCYHATNESPVWEREFADEMGLSSSEFTVQVYELLYTQDMVKRGQRCWTERDLGHSIWLEPMSVPDVEARGLVDAAAVAARTRVREHLLRMLAAAYRRGGLTHRLLVQDMETAEHPWPTVEKELEVLEANGFVDLDQVVGRAWGITSEGLEMLRDIEARDTLATKLADIEILPPQRRGKALEGIIAASLRLQGCHCVEDTGGQGEQIDLFVESGSAFFVCEAKWLKNRVEAGVVEQMIGRMMKRPPVVAGVIFSMSDFTPGASERAERAAGDRVILLIDGAATRAVIRGEWLFNDIVQEQLRSLVRSGRLRSSHS